MGLVIYPSWLIACRRQLVISHFLQDKSFKRGSNVNLSSSVSVWHAITRLHFVLCIPLPLSFPIHARGIRISTVPYWTPSNTLILSCSHGLHIGGGVERHFHLHWYSIAVLLQMHYIRTNRIFNSLWCSHDVVLNNPHSFFFFGTMGSIYYLSNFAVREWVFFVGGLGWWMGAAWLLIKIRPLLTASCRWVCVFAVNNQVHCSHLNM